MVPQAGKRVRQPHFTVRSHAAACHLSALLKLFKSEHGLALKFQSFSLCFQAVIWGSTTKKTRFFKLYRKVELTALVIPVCPSWMNWTAAGRQLEADNIWGLHRLGCVRGAWSFAFLCLWPVFFFFPWRLWTNVLSTPDRVLVKTKETIPSKPEPVSSLELLEGQQMTHRPWSLTGSPQHEWGHLAATSW